MAACPPYQSAARGLRRSRCVSSARARRNDHGRDTALAQTAAQLVDIDFRAARRVWRIRVDDVKNRQRPSASPRANRPPRVRLRGIRRCVTTTAGCVVRPERSADRGCGHARARRRTSRGSAGSTSGRRTSTPKQRPAALLVERAGRLPTLVEVADVPEAVIDERHRIASRQRPAVVDAISQTERRDVNEPRARERRVLLKPRVLNHRQVFAPGQQPVDQRRAGTAARQAATRRRRGARAQGGLRARAGRPRRGRTRRPFRAAIVASRSTRRPPGAARAPTTRAASVPGINTSSASRY